jgi:hypothetical protein
VKKVKITKKFIGKKVKIKEKKMVRDSAGSNFFNVIRASPKD